MNTYGIKYYFYGNNSIIPFDYHDYLIRFLHIKILGNNKYHDTTSLYSISPLYNSKSLNNGLVFNKGAIWMIKTPSPEIFYEFHNKSIKAIGNELVGGLILKNVELKIEEFNEINEINFGVSKIYLGQNPNTDKRDHITYKHDKELISKYIKRPFNAKIKLLGYNDINDDDYTVEFDYEKELKIKPVKINNSISITTNGHLKITGNSNIIGLFYGLGVGLSTGCGLGYVYDIKK